MNVTLLCLLLSLISSIKGLLMFDPHPGPSCSDNAECASGCCLMTSRKYRKPYGVCQNLPTIGEYCVTSPTLRNYGGWKVHIYSCPCIGGLECSPDWALKLIGQMRVIKDPQCMPANMSDVELHVRGYQRPPPAPPGNSNRIYRPRVMTPPPN